ncbi:MAG: ribosome recycling factor [Flavobacteriaceae bacterium]
MEEAFEIIVETSKESMQETVEHLEREFLNIRAGKANPVMLSSVQVEYYGAQTPLNQVANVNSPDARTLTVQPFDKNLLADIEKAILVANLGFNPMNNGESIIINIPPLTEERRKELARMAKAAAEEAKVSIRNVRKDANNEIKKTEGSEDLKKNYEVDVQELTDGFVKQIDSLFSQKEQEILTV